MTQTPDGRADAALPQQDATDESTDLPAAQPNPPSYGYGSPAAGTDASSLEDDSGES